MSAKILDKVKLIKSVYQHSIIWDQKSEHYLDRDLAKIAWEEVAKEVDLPCEVCRKKWRSLRDIFKKEKKKQELGKKSNWRYMKALDFLSEQAKNDSQSDQVETDNQTDQEDNNQVEYLVPNAAELDIEDNKDFLREITSKEDAESNNSFSTFLHPPRKRLHHDHDGFDEDYYFLMSLLPSIKALPQKRKNVVRAKILQILCEENV